MGTGSVQSAPMGVQQINATYDEREDRVLLRVCTDAGEETKVWLTRRLLLRLRPLMESAAADLARMGAGEAAHADDWCASLAADQARERSIADADFSTPYEAPPAEVGATAVAPLLAHEVTVQVRGAEGVTIHMEEHETVDDQPCARGMELQASADAYHGLLHLLDLAVNAAAWRDDTEYHHPIDDSENESSAYSNHKHQRPTWLH
jgi:hypothetical protein